MLRTQISLTVEERRLLGAESESTGRSIAALIRDAIQLAYGTRRSHDDDLVDMRRASGSWKDHELDGAAWVDQVRSGSRLTNS